MAQIAYIHHLIGGVSYYSASMLFPPRSKPIASKSLPKWWPNMSPPPYWRQNIYCLALLTADNELSHWLNQRGVRVEKTSRPIFANATVIEKVHCLSNQSQSTMPKKIWGSQNCKLKIANCKLQIAGQGRGPEIKSRFFRLHPSFFILHPSSFIPALRIIDAAANRAREGLRVAEDFVRFVLDDRHLTEQCKQLRHDLAALLRPDTQRAASGRPRNTGRCGHFA